MSTEPLVIVDGTYESVAATCPACGHRSVYNRRSDLNTTEAISREGVTCDSCRSGYSIGGDMINPAHQMLLLDAGASLQCKQYMQAVLGVAQSFEVFFDHFLHVRLVYRPFVRDGTADIDDLNRLKDQLYSKVEAFTFEPMRRLFLQCVVNAVKPHNVAAAQGYIAWIPDQGRDVPGVARRKIETIPTERLRDLLLGLSRTSVNALRNKVVHKDAERPTREQATEAYDEACRIIFGLTNMLGVQGNALYYINGGTDED